MERAGGRSMIRAATALNAKHVLFGVMGVMLLFVLWNNERFLLDPADPHWTHLAPAGWRLAPHGLFGSVALFTGALQFSSRLRRNRPRHRLIGRTYAVSAVTACCFAMWMATLLSPWFLIVFTWTQGLSWIACIVMAVAMARRREFEQHRAWMMRGYAIGLIFIEGRVLMAIPWLGAHGLDAVVAVNWALLVVSLLAVDLWLQWEKLSLRQGKTAYARSG